MTYLPDPVGPGRVLEGFVSLVELEAGADHWLENGGVHSGVQAFCHRR
ncbi:hypothetical protein NOCD_02160 [Nocardioides cavernae]|nr:MULTISPECIES: hypothetical protein [Nocardioides]MCK9822283.1 hypothetical protein [Nocardioides cavernae]